MANQARSVENVGQHLLPPPPVRFSTASVYVSSMSGGVVYDAFPVLATALTPLPASASSHSQILSSHNEMIATAVEVLKQPEPNHSASLDTKVLDHGRLLALAPTRIQDGAKTSASVDSKTFDVYEFRDEDDSEFACLGVGLRRGKPSGSVTNSAGLPQTSHWSLQNDSQPTGVRDLTKKCHSASETDAGMMSTLQNVAMIFDMDSKSIRRISLPVKPEPVSLSISASDSVPLSAINASLHVTQSTNCMSVNNEALRVGHKKRSLPIYDVNCKQVRLNNNNASSYQAFEIAGTNSHLPNIQDLISNVRNVNEYGNSMITVDSWPEKSRLSQQVNFTARSQSLPTTYGNVRYPVTPSYTTFKLVDVSTRNHAMIKCENESLNSLATGQLSVTAQSTRNPSTWLFNGNAANAVNNTCNIRASKPVPVSGQSVYPMFAGCGYHRYGIHQQNSMAVSHRPGSNGEAVKKYESDTEQWHTAKTNHSNAVQSTCDEKNSFEERNKHENLQPVSSSCVLDLCCNNSKMSPSASMSCITLGHSGYPNLLPAAVASRYNDSHIQQTVASGLSPHLPFSLDSHHHHHHQQQQHQQLAQNMKKEDVEERKTVTTDEEKLMNRLKCNLIEEVLRCQCQGLLLVI